MAGQFIIGGSYAIPVQNPTSYGAVGNGIADDSAAIAKAVAAGGNVYLSGTYAILTNTTLPNTASLQFATGATMAPGVGVTLTIGGTIIADTQAQIFGGAGAVLMSAGSQQCVYPDWFGAPTGANNPVQLACNAAHPVGIEVRLNNKQYNLGVGSTGLSVTNANARIIGVAESQTGGAGTGYPILNYTGTGTAVSATSVYGCRFENFLIQCALGTNIGLYVNNATNGLVRRVRVYGQAGASNYCVSVANNVNTAFEFCDFHGGALGGSDYELFATGIYVGGGTSTTSPFRNCYVHYCSVGINQALGFENFDNCVVESCARGFLANGSNMKYDNCWFENNGKSNPDSGTYLETCGYVSGNSVVEMFSPHIVPYAGQNVIFTVSGAGKLRVVEGDVAGSPPVPVTTIAVGANPQVTLGSPLFLGGTNNWYVTIAGVTGMTGANGTWPITRVDDSHFTINGTTTAGTFGGTATAQATTMLFYGASETGSSDIVVQSLRMTPGGGGVAVNLQNPSALNTTLEVLNWTAAKFPKLQFARYRFITKSVTTGTPGNMACDSGYAGAAFVMPANGYLCDAYVYTSMSRSGGTLQCQIKQNGSTILLDTGSVSAFPAAARRGVLSAPVSQGDVITALLTPSSFSPNGAGQDVVCEMLVALGDGRS